MDIADINKVANRKRLNVDAEKLREKVSRETAKIIKLKVAQDTAYWDLKEKLSQLENNHERLQQNMVEVQMQHETISGQYQDELRLRPETLNKLSSTREICNVLEEYSERLKETLARSKSDQAALCDAYQKSGLLVRELKAKQLQAEEKNRGLVSSLEDKLKVSTEHQSQLLELFNSLKRQAETEARELRARLDAALAQRDDFVRTNNDLARELDQHKFSLEAKTKAVVSAQTDMKRLLQEFNSQCTDMKNTIIKQENELKESSEASSSLRTALAQQEQFSRGLCERVDELQAQLAAREDDVAGLGEQLLARTATVQELTATNDSLRQDIAALTNDKEALEKEIAEKDTNLAEISKGLETLRSDLDEAQSEKATVQEELANTKNILESKLANIDELNTNIIESQRKITELESTLEEYRTTSDEKIKELTNSLDTKQSENVSKAETINKLMNDIKMCLEVRSRLEAALDKARRELDSEKEVAKDREAALAKQLEQLENVVKSKETELSQQVTIILDMRSEKERLQEKIQGMQKTIDNIQKELTGKIAPREHHVEAEQDDNAVSMTPTKTFFPPPARTSKAKDCAPPDSVFNIFSDSSMDGDAVDPAEVNRRFEAITRGERAPPLPLAALKRRRGVSTSQGIAKRTQPTPNNDNPISLSQVREDMKMKEKVFFKNKRPENKLKRFKRLDDAVI